MALAPMLLIGCGGSGGKVIAGLRKRLLQELRLAGWTEGIPTAWQLLYVDTPAAQEVNLEFGSPVPQTDYISTAMNVDVYSSVDEALVNAASQHQNLDRLLGWRPSPDLQLAVHLGAGQWRGVGRSVGFRGLSRVGQRIERAMGEFTSGQAQLQRLGALLGDPTAPVTKPFVVVISSMAGGTGAGIFMDVCDVVRAVDPQLSDQIMAVLFTAEVFKNIGQAPGLQPNTVAALSELMAGYFDRNRRLESLFTGLVQEPRSAVGGSGPSYPFVVGMSTVNGTPIEEVGDCYRIVTETILAAMTRSDVYKQLMEYQVGNWSVNAANQTTTWRFGQGVLAAGDTVPGGMLSSFGSARLCVGSAMFGEYAVARLTREVLQFLVDGYIAQGRELLRDPQATAEQVLAYFRETRGLSFVEACHLRELDLSDGVEYNQVIESVMSSDELRRITNVWYESLKGELSGIGSRTKAGWLDAMQQLLPMRRGTFIEGVRASLDKGVATMVADLPQVISNEVSRAMFELGIPVAKTLVDFAREHVDAAVTQLHDQARARRESTSRWVSFAMNRLAGMGDRDSVLVTDDRVTGTPQSPGALRSAVTTFAVEEALAMRMDRAAEVLTDISRDILGPIGAMLDQIGQSIGGASAHEQWGRFPEGESVPVSYRPTPFDFCLIPAEEWPQAFDRLVAETVRREQPEDRVEVGGTIRYAETVRRLVGGGGFSISEAGLVRRSPSALAARNWERGRSLHLETSLTVEDVFERAREWAERKSTPLGDFIGQDLDAYLRPIGPDGQAVADHGPRLDRFKDLLSKALQAATPLVALDTNMLARVHPQSHMNTQPAKTRVEPLPIDGPAREVAREVLEQHLRTVVRTGSDSDGRTDFSLFSDGSTKRESVLIVSQLQGPVHPSTIRSVTQEVTRAWNGVRGSVQGISTFWQYRRARTLPEFVPVAPQVLDHMIQGWFVGRMLGAIPDPTRSDGFTIASLDEFDKVVETPFPWPLLRNGTWGDEFANSTHRLEWLPAILEHLGLAYALLPTNSGILDPYERMFDLGLRRGVVLDWILTGRFEAQIADPQVHGATPEERRASVVEGIRRSQDTYAAHMSRQLSGQREHFFSLPYGRSVYPLITKALENILNSIPEEGVGGDAGGVG